MKAIVLAALVACGKSPSTPDASTAFCTDQTPAPTFANVQTLFSTICVTCHTTGAPLNLEAPAYSRIVNTPAVDYTDPAVIDSCGGTLVVPGDSAASYLFVKISSDSPCAGVRMPRTDIGTSAPLPMCAQNLIHDWIDAGAPN
ncbi:MAG: hypothetical protein JO257_25900 [Deltaproteobacteria bacterium]|nr:hypothetical protein [Deltaproteobacteria bacterium]